MASFNKVILIGNLTRDPEVRVMPSGASICKFSIAVSRSFKGQDGEQREETAFIDIDAFGKQAEVIGKFMQKGKPILVEGRLKLDQWESQAGEKRSKLGVVLESFQFIGARSDSASDDEFSQSQTASAPQFVENLSKSSKGKQSVDLSDLDEDVPF